LCPTAHGQQQYSSRQPSQHLDKFSTSSSLLCVCMGAKYPPPSVTYLLRCQTPEVPRADSGYRYFLGYFWSSTELVLLDCILYFLPFDLSVFHNNSPLISQFSITTVGAHIRESVHQTTLYQLVIRIIALYLMDQSQNSSKNLENHTGPKLELTE
jgi:hypothetical protein